MDKLLTFLSGKKTYLVSALAVAVNFAVYMQWLTVDQLAQVNAILAFFGLASVRAGVSKK
jgi:hypothetical protein